MSMKRLSQRFRRSPIQEQSVSEIRDEVHLTYDIYTTNDVVATESPGNNPLTPRDRLSIPTDDLKSSPRDKLNNSNKLNSNNKSLHNLTKSRFSVVISTIQQLSDTLSFSGKKLYTDQSSISDKTFVSINNDSTIESRSLYASQSNGVTNGRITSLPRNKKLKPNDNNNIDREKWDDMILRLKNEDFTLHEINFQNLPTLLTNVDFYNLSIHLKNNRSIRKIILNNMNLTDINCSTLCSSFYTCKGLQYLSLEGNMIDKGMESICSLLAAHPSLTTLNVLNQNNYKPMLPPMERKFAQACNVNHRIIQVDFQCTSSTVLDQVNRYIDRNIQLKLKKNTPVIKMDTIR